jgi:hypothetical protein
MKPAVFQITDPNGSMRLVCIRVPTLGDAVSLEMALRRQLPRMEIRFLGRFDRVEIAATVEEFLEAAASTDFVCAGGFEGLMRRLLREE